MRVGIIGGGHIASIHGPLIQQQPDTQIVSIADKDTSRANALAAELTTSSVQVYDDAQQMLSEQKLDVVHVLVPPHLHADLSILAMEQGCHVFVEKPMALTEDDAQKMIDASQRHQILLWANHNMVFEESVLAAKKLVAEGNIGDIVTVEANYSFNPQRYPAILAEGAEWSHWSYRMPGGPLQDLMPHPASLVLEFMQDFETVQSTATNRGVLPEGWQDEVRVLLNSGSVMGYICLSMSERPDTVLLTIKGTQGTLQANLFNNVLTLQQKSSLPRAIARGLSGFELSLQNLKGSIQNISQFAKGNLDKTNGLGSAIAAFYAAIRNDVDRPQSLDQGYQVVKLMDQIWPTPTGDTSQKFSVASPSLDIPQAPTALITGASGFIGTYLIQRLLTEKIGIRALVRPSSQHLGRLKTLPVDIAQGSLTDPAFIAKSMQGIETIYHAAAPVGSNDWDNHYQVTVKATETLINTAIDYGVKRLVFISSLSVYDLLALRNGATVNEETACYSNPKAMGPYVDAKLAAEHLLLEAYRSHHLGVTIIRPGIVIGPKGVVRIPHIGYKVQDRSFLVLGTGENILPLTYVENTVDGIYKASIAEKAIGQIYNLVDEGEVTVNQYINRLKSVSGSQASVIHLPTPFLYTASSAYELGSSLGLLKKGVTSWAQIQRKMKSLKYENHKAKNELNWEPKISIEFGLQKTFDWYCQQTQ